MDQTQNLTIYATNICNLRCKHCFYHDSLNKPADELSLEQIDKLIKEANPLSVTFCGGEPMLRRTIVEACEVATKNNVKKITIHTNGFFPEKTKESVRKILELGCTLNVDISLDGLQNTHNKIRGRLSFERLSETIKLLKPIKEENKNLNLCVRTVITKDNYEELEKLADFIDDNLGIPHYFELIRGINTCGVPKPMMNDTYSPESPDLFLTEENMGKLKPILAKIFGKRGKNPLEYARQATQYNLFLQYMEILRKKKAPVVCSVGRKAIIYPEGDVTLCEFMKPVGNVKEDTFENLFHNKEADKQRAIAKNCYCTHGCFMGEMLMEKKLKPVSGRIISSAKLFSDYYLN